MVKPLQTSDFRAIRRILEPEDFAWGSDEPDPPPTDLVDADTWHSIVDGPDDVSIRTSSYQGTLLRILDALWGAWIEAVGENQDQLGEVMVDATDEFQAATFNALNGFYRQSIGSLRNALELVTVGTYCQVCNKTTEYRQWRGGLIELSFGTACDGLMQASAIQSLNSHLNTLLGDSLFNQKSKTVPGGWVRRLYSDLSDYSHSRPSFTNADMWASNGPVYVPDVFELTARMQFKAYACCFLLVKLGRTDFVLPTGALQLFESDGLRSEKIAFGTFKFLFHTT